MKYALRLTRNLRTHAVTVHPIVRVQDSAKGYSMRYTDDYAETLQIFTTLKEAKNARENEQLAADLAAMSAEERLEFLRRDMEYLESIGVPRCPYLRLMNLPEETFNAYLDSRHYVPNPRYVARFHVTVEAIKAYRKKLPSILPGVGCGNPLRWKGYGKNPKKT